MIEANWEVLSYCRTCHLTTYVDLTVIQRIKGPDFNLWNQHRRGIRQTTTKIG